MTTLSKPFTTHLPAFSAKLRGIAGSTLRGVATLLNTVVHRREVRHMLELDDRALRDIGLVRNDVLGALAEPLMRDPSDVLMARSVERQSRLRLLARATDQMRPRP